MIIIFVTVRNHFIGASKSKSNELKNVLKNTACYSFVTKINQLISRGGMNATKLIQMMVAQRTKSSPMYAPKLHSTTSQNQTNDKLFNYNMQFKRKVATKQNTTNPILVNSNGKKTLI